MHYLTVNAQGQVTLKKEMLQHLGIFPGDEVALDLLPDGRVVLQAVRTDHTLHPLTPKNKKATHIEEVNAAIARAWADRVSQAARLS